MILPSQENEENMWNIILDVHVSSRWLPGPGLIEACVIKLTGDITKTHLHLKGAMIELICKDL